MAQTSELYGGMVVGKRNRYRHMEIMMTRIILGICVAFILFVLFSWRGLNTLKYISGIVTMIASGLSLGWLYITGEFKHRRSLWMVTAFFAFIICTLVSMMLHYPAPPVTL